MTKFTHTGKLESCTSMDKDGASQTVRLRATTRHWVTHHQLKYYKVNGSAVTDGIARWRLNLESIKPIE